MVAKQYYDPADLLDAPEHHRRAEAAGVLTWGTWDHAERPVEERIKDFRDSYPPEDPIRHCGGSLARMDGEYRPGDLRSRLERFLATDWRPGSLHALLATFGLKLRRAPEGVARPLELAPTKEVAFRRNMKLRVLHGTIDASPEDMTAAKAQYLDQQEKRQAASEIRQARKRMRDELK